MVEIHPFRGLRYAESLAEPGVYAPPYDVIDPDQRAALLTQNPHSIVHLDLGPTPIPPTWYAEAAATLEDWLARGVLQRDKEPSLYGYRQAFAWGGRRYARTGFLARVRLVPWGQGIHRHELTRNQPKADRLQLMRALDMQTSPVFGLFDDAQRVSAELLASSLAEANETISFADGDGVTHTFWRIVDAAGIAALQAALADSDVVIADGHHRYETAQALAAERRAAKGPSAADDVLMCLVPLADPGLLVLATHRVITLPALDVGRLLRDLARTYTVTPTTEVLTMAIAGQTGAFGLHVPGRSFTLVPRLADGGTELDVVRLQQTILEPLLGISAGHLADADLISYTIHEDQACAAVDEGRATLALILNPTPLQAIWDTALRGKVMPQKSTFFHPKLFTGLVMNPLWD